MSSFGVPGYWRRLSDPNVKTVFITGCGGGFDFVHSMTVIPELLRQGKEVVIASYSFGDARQIQNTELVWTAPPVLPSDVADDSAKVVSAPLDDAALAAARKGSSNVPPDVYAATAASVAPRSYGPEVGICAYLDKHFPRKDGAPWTVYASNGRLFTVRHLRAFYRWVCNKHAVDAVLIIDGGSDSLMIGDEAGLGDPIEDATSVCAASTFDRFDPSCDHPSLKDEALLDRPIQHRVLIAIGFGCDRANEVSDGASLRAVAELTAARTKDTNEPGFLGSMALEPDSPLLQHYSALIDYLQATYNFPSVIANSIVSCGEGGHYAADWVPPKLRLRVQKGSLFLWPLMSWHFAFHPTAIFERSLLCPRLLSAPSIAAMYDRLGALRKELKQQGKIRDWESLPK